MDSDGNKTLAFLVVLENTAVSLNVAGVLVKRIAATRLISEIVSVSQTAGDALTVPPGVKPWPGNEPYTWRRAAAAARDASADFVAFFTPENVFFHTPSLREMLSSARGGAAQIVSPENFIRGAAPVVVSLAALDAAIAEVEKSPALPGAERFLRLFTTSPAARAVVAAPQPLARPDLSIDIDTASEFLDDISALDASDAAASEFYARLVARIEEKQRAASLSHCESIRRWPHAAIRRGSRHKIAFLSNSSTVSGAEKYILELAASASGSEFDFVFISPDDGELSALARAAGATVAHAPLAPLATGAPAYMASVSEITRILSTQGVSLLHINSIYACQMGAPAGRAAGIPVFSHLHDIAVEHRIAAASMLHSCDAVLAVSDAAKNAALSWGVPAAIVQMIHNGVDLETFRPKRKGDAPHPGVGNDGGPDFVITGNLVPWKGQRVFIRAAAIVLEKLPCARFYIAGAEIFSGAAGGYTAELRGIIESLGISSAVKMLGRTDDVPALLRSCDVAVHASTIPDPFPYTVIEAMACGLPVIGADLGGVPEAIGDEAGLLYTPGDEGALAAAMIDLAGSTDKRAQIGAAARARAEKLFDVNINTSKVLDLYRAALPALEGR